jgi:hypothetical protein
MGYVLPVRHYEYESYHRRVIGNENRPFLLEEPLPVRFKKQHQGELVLPLKKKNVPKENTYKAKVLKKQQDTVAELTGKGLLFNETI